MSIRRLTRTGLSTFAVLVGGLLFGAPVVFAAAPEVPKAEAVTTIAATTATLNGVLSPNALVAGEGGTYEFLYKASKTGQCTGGLKAPQPAVAFAGSPAEVVSQPVENLTADTEYAVCLRVENAVSHEEAVSPAVTFKTALPPETPKTEAASVVTGTTATLKGVLNPVKAGEAGTYEFTYQPSKTKECTAGSVAPEPPGVALGGAKEAVSAPVTGLEGSTEYAFCVVAINKAEPAESAMGAPVTFKTSAAEPVIPNESISGITPFDGVLNAQVNPEKQETTYSYEYADEEAKLGTVEAASIGAGSLPGTSEVQTANPADIGADIGGALTPATTYYYRLVATNGTGTTDGKTESFTTSAFVVPAVEAEFPTAVGQSTASLSAIVNPEFQPVLKCEFVYTASASLSAPCTPGAAELGEGGAGVATGVNLTGLLPNTTYHYKVLAENKIGAGEAPEEAFTTLPALPVASTGAATAITTNSASITGTVNPNNSDQAEQDDTKYHFEYGQDTSYGKRTLPATEAIGEGMSPVEETASLDGLIPGRTYHYRIVASNNNNATPQLAYGQDEQFTTAGSPPPPLTGGPNITPSSSAQAPTPTPGAFPNLTAIVPVPATKEPGETTPSEPKSLTRAQKLSKALKQCKRDHRKSNRVSCEKRARGKYGPKTSKGKRGKN